MGDSRNFSADLGRARHAVCSSVAETKKKEDREGQLNSAKPRTLILGFDGGDAAIFDAFDMPFYRELAVKGHEFDLNEDLLSRGWSEIVTGRQAEYTGGLYFRPLPPAEKRPVLSEKFSLKEMLADPGTEPIWDMANRLGATFGMIGVPTTSPAPKVDGFTVSGGGGGVGKIEGVPDGFCQPPELAALLEEMDYQFDVRMSTMPEKTFPAFIERVETVIASNVDALIKLDREIRADLNFICLRPTTGLQYLARFDIEDAIASRGEQSHANPNVELLRRHYAFLDNEIRRLFEALKPDRFMLTADHGTANYLKRVNINALLVRHSLQSPRAKTASSAKSVLRKLKALLPRPVSSRLGKTVRKSLSGLEMNFDAANSQAFGSYHMRGIYILDAHRFGGPVNAEDVDALTDRICQLCNDDPVLQAEGITARPKRRDFSEASQSWQLPDVELVAPDTVFFVSSGPLIEDNPNYRATPHDLTYVHNPHSGTKGSRPLMLTDTETAALAKGDDPDDLRLVYRLVERIYA
ncbi:alkaline phosphatase family protein [Aurantiacibacter zhengii]|uniref:alkaline phosphatase family protein n=1 Tax=Aurantiacibacter zhengii TaxID=2307003 RepID=UPI001314F269|nr:alkaline phosphatase family protein [Aurantiacibacter zhengii]